MAENPNKPVETWELRDFMQSTRDFRAELEKELEAFRIATRAIPEMQREVQRQSVALFATNDDNEFGVPGVLTIARELIIGLRWGKWIIYVLCAAVVSLLGLLIGIMQKLAALGVLDALMK